MGREDITYGGHMNDRGDTVTTEQYSVCNIQVTITKVEGKDGSVDYYIDKQMYDDDDDD